MKQLGDTNAQAINAVVVDKRGNVVAAGYGCGKIDGSRYRNGAIDFGAGPRELVGECGLFVVEYAPNGKLQWIYSDGEDGERSEANALALMSSGDILFAGRRGPDMLLGQLNRDGKLVSSHRFCDPTGGDGAAAAHAIAIAPDGDWLVAGDATSRTDLGTGLLQHIGTVSFVARYSADGKPRWVKYPSAPSKYQASASAVAVASNGSVFACGKTDGSGGGSSAGSFVQCLDGSTGDVQWTKNGPGGECYAVVPFADTVVAAGVLSDDAILIAYAADGGIRWLTHSSSDGFVPTALALDGARLVVAGRGLGTHLKFLELDAKGAETASRENVGDLQINAIALSPVHTIVVGGQLEGAADLGTGSAVEPRVQDPEDGISNTDAVLAWLSSPWTASSARPAQPSLRP